MTPGSGPVKIPAMKKLKMVPQLEACTFPADVDDELSDHDITTHYRSDDVWLDWEAKDDDGMPLLKAWLLETFGEEVRDHEFFTISPT